MVLGFGETLPVQTPDTFTAMTRVLHESGGGQYAQVLGDGLTGDAGACGEIGDGQRSAVAESGD